MNQIDLIANSGLQFIVYKLDLGHKSNAMKVSRDFAEIPELVNGEEEIFLRFPYYHSKINKYIRLDELNRAAFDPEDGSVNEDRIDHDFISVIKDQFINSVSAREALQCFENSWIPVPYLRYTKSMDQNSSRVEFQAGPNSWSRMFITTIPETKRKDEFTHYLTLAFDTTCRLDDENDQNWWLPKLSNEYDDKFEYKCDSLDENLAFTERNQSLIRKAFEKKPEFKDSELYLKEFQLYLTLLSVLDKASWRPTERESKQAVGFPDAALHDPADPPIDVALVLDVGNSRTCGILAEVSENHARFDITKSVPLEIRDFSRPYLVYNQPFEMQVAFVKPPFDANDDIFGFTKPFTWPSICRIGPESVRYSIIYSGVSSNSLLSSPKRYLWDEDGQPDSWEFLEKINDKKAEIAIDEVLTPELTVDGKNIKKEIELREFDDDEGMIHPAIDRANFSRSSLMKMAFVEIFLHTIAQINSTTFRGLSHKKLIRRRISKIVLTCPTAMLRTERFILRDHADGAIKLIKDIYVQGKDSSLSGELEIVPDPNTIHKPTAKRQAETWEYDEATCSQITFLYSEIKDRFKNADLFIKSLGRKRSNATFPENQAITIASIDIGGGTTDVMIASYQTNPTSKEAIVAKPLFWEGFNLAGDNILKSVIERLVIPTIHDHAKTLANNNNNQTLTNAIIELFGPYTGHQRSSDVRQLKKHIVNQILVPVAQDALEFVKEQNDYIRLEFNDIYSRHDLPNPRIIEYINSTFARNNIEKFDIRDVTYQLRSEEINGAIHDILKNTLPQLSSVISQYHCDFVLLAGRPSNLPVVRNLLLQYLPTTPDKIVQLGSYWMGEWYPFIKTAGYINDPKTCVSVGALIALLSGQMGKLNGFSLDLSELSKVESTADYIGKFDKPYVQPFRAEKGNEQFLNKHDKTIHIDFFDHAALGMKQLNNEQWIGSKMYEIRKVHHLFEQYKNQQPFKLEVQRPNPLNIEELSLRKIVDKNGKTLDSGTLELKLNTLDDEYGYWLDTGIFNIELFSQK